MATDSTGTPLPFRLTALDREILSMSNDEFSPHTWEEIKQIIAENDLHLFKRWPSDLRRYIKWSADTKAAYGNIPNFVMRERLRWTPLPSSTAKTGPEFAVEDPTPFAHEADYKILINDWPYGLDEGIRHIIVWLKTRLESEPTRGDMTPKSRQQVEQFIHTNFVNRVKDLPGEEEKVVWFKNWTALQSVPGMEHVHVLVRDVPDHVIAEWTGGVQSWNVET
ncbi:hypothetical protein LTR67_009845 [Exophiala xenobiotica]